MKSKYRILLVFCLLFSISLNLSALEERDTIIGSQLKLPQSVGDFFEHFDFSLYMTPSLYAHIQENPADTPSTVFFPFAIALQWPNTSFISFQPSLSVYTMYYGWSEKGVVPIEMENRTASSVNVMINVPVVITLFFPRKSKLQMSIGPGFLMRFAFLASGVHDSDSGFSGNAGDDVSAINSWFWEKGRFLNLNTEVAFMIQITEKIKTGPVFSANIPILAFIADHSADGMIFSAGIKFSF